MFALFIFLFMFALTKSNNMKKTLLILISVFAVLYMFASFLCEDIYFFSWSENAKTKFVCTYFLLAYAIILKKYTYKYE